jgi:hypothetical protein
MSSRERNLAVLLIALILVFGSAAAGYALIYQPIQSKNAAAAKLEADVAKKQDEYDKLLFERKKLGDLRRRSLPADPALARREYAEMMSRLLIQAKVPSGFRVRDLTPDNTGTPALAGKKLAYTKLAYEITFARADMWNVHDFLLAYYKLPLLHQITLLDIKTDAQPASSTRGKVVNDRRDLMVKIVTEAIILDGAEPRRSLFSVPVAFAAVGGLSGHHALGHTPEASRNLSHGDSPVLADRDRDYTLIVRNDIFHGPLPLPPSMNIERIADISVEQDKTISPVKVRVAGDVGPSGKVTLEVKADGKVLTEGTVKIDQTAKTIAILPMEGETGSGEITVTARTPDGKEAKTRFKVKITEPEKEEVKALPEISDSIKLIIAATRSDGTASAIIRDNFNPFTYEIEVTPSGRIKITKFYFLSANKKKDRDYLPDESSHLVFSDDGVSTTSRSFRVVAIDSEGLYILDLKPKAEVKPKGLGVRPVASLKQGPADPLAAVVGSAAMVKPTDTDPVLYRWTIGSSLKGLKEVPKDEAKRIVDQAKLGGPVAAN